jgi:uncharacterized protein DUF6600
MNFRRTVRRMVLAGLLALLAFAPGVSLPGTAKLGLGGPALAQTGVAQDGFAIDQFYDELAPYGEWIHHKRFGYVWLPRTVAQGWRPYTVGQWVYTDEHGWYWDSYEPFAWAVYHYGRWGYDHAYGWYWVPGDTWAPAWVQWRYGTDYVGWAPVGPSPYGGYAYGGPKGYAPSPPEDAWVFVKPLYLTSSVVLRHILQLSDVRIALNRTTYVYRPQYRNGSVYNYGMPRDHWSRITRQHVEPRKIHRGHSKTHSGKNNRRGRDIYVYAPGVKQGVKPRRAPKTVSHTPSKAKRYGNGGGKANKGGVWSGNRPVKANVPSYARPPALHPRGPRSTINDPRFKHKPKASKPKHSKPKASKGKAKSKASESKSSNAKSKPKSASRGNASKWNASKPKAWKPRPASGGSASKGKPSKGKASKPKASKSKAASGGKASKAKISKAKESKPRVAKSRPPKPKSAQAKSGKGKSKSAKSKPKSATSKSASAKQDGNPGPDGGGKRGGGRGGS